MNPQSNYHPPLTYRSTSRCEYGGNRNIGIKNKIGPNAPEILISPINLKNNLYNNNTRSNFYNRGPQENNPKIPTTLAPEIQAQYYEQSSKNIVNGFCPKQAIHSNNILKNKTNMERNKPFYSKQVIHSHNMFNNQTNPESNRDNHYCNYQLGGNIQQPNKNIHNSNTRIQHYMNADNRWSNKSNSMVNNYGNNPYDNYNPNINDYLVSNVNQNYNTNIDDCIVSNTNQNKIINENNASSNFYYNYSGGNRKCVPQIPNSLVRAPVFSNNQDIWFNKYNNIDQRFINESQNNVCNSKHSNLSQSRLGNTTLYQNQNQNTNTSYDDDNYNVFGNNKSLINEHSIHSAQNNPTRFQSSNSPLYLNPINNTLHYNPNIKFNNHTSENLYGTPFNSQAYSSESNLYHVSPDDDFHRYNITQNQSSLPDDRLQCYKNQNQSSLPDDRLQCYTNQNQFTPSNINPWENKPMVIKTNQSNKNQLNGEIIVENVPKYQNLQQNINSIPLNKINSADYYYRVNEIQDLSTRINSINTPGPSFDMIPTSLIKENRHSVNNMIDNTNTNMQTYQNTAGNSFNVISNPLSKEYNCSPINNKNTQVPTMEGCSTNYPIFIDKNNHLDCIDGENKFNQDLNTNLDQLEKYDNPNYTPGSLQELETIQVNLKMLANGPFRISPCDIIFSCTETEGNKISFDIIEEGSFGKVYFGKTKFGLPVAIKIPVVEMQKSDPIGVLERIVSEWRLLQRLSHPGIVDLVGCIVYSTFDIWIVTKYIFGSDLHALKYSTDKNIRRRITAKNAINMCRQLARVVAYLHSPIPNEKNIVVHRDIKPENVIIDKNWNLFLCDFGDAEETIDGRVSNLSGATWFYAPPELLKSDPLNNRYNDGTLPVLDQNWDIWSMGCVFHELFGLPNPNCQFINNTDSLDDIYEKLKLVAIKDKLIPTICDKIQGKARKIIRSCLNPDPNQRPTALEVYQSWNQPDEKFLKDIHI